jgi:hypothetical protein
MTTNQVANSLRRILYEYNRLTNNGNVIQINHCFNINYFQITLNNYTNEKGIVVNKLSFHIKRVNNKKANTHILNKLFPNDITNKIMNEYFKKYDTITLIIEIEYDPLNYPYHPPLWKFVSINNIGFVSETENAFRYLIDSHNDILLNDWSCAIDVTTDLNYFISKMVKLMGHI